MSELKPLGKLMVHILAKTKVADVKFKPTGMACLWWYMSFGLFFCPLDNDYQMMIMMNVFNIHRARRKGRYGSNNE